MRLSTLVHSCAAHPHEPSPGLRTRPVHRPVPPLCRSCPGPKVFQLYVWKDRGLLQEVIQRAKEGGFNALALTVDFTWYGNRERDIRNGARSAPAASPRAHPALAAAARSVAASCEAGTSVVSRALETDARVRREKARGQSERRGRVPGVSRLRTLAPAWLLGAACLVLEHRGRWLARRLRHGGKRLAIVDGNPGCVVHARRAVPSGPA